MRQSPRHSFSLPRLRRFPASLLTAALFFLATTGIGAQATAAQEPQSGATQPATKPAAEPAAAPSSNSQEVVTRDSDTTFKVRVNLVLVRVVVRDEHGKAVDNLKKQDFLLFDNRKPQTISTFTVETPASHIVPVVTVSDQPDADSQQKTIAAALPQRFVALLFDDVHLAMEDAMSARLAAGKIFDALAPSDRVAIYTTSGQFTQDFTSDRDVLKKSLNQITPHPLAGDPLFHDCPDISYYQADMMVNKSDPQALAVAVQDTIQCAFGNDSSKTAQATTLANSTAQRVLSSGDATTDFVYRHLEDNVRHLAAMPGQRKLVFISPGFILTTLLADRVDIIDRSNRAGVVIDTLDARGLYTPDMLGDIASPAQSAYTTAGEQTTFRLQAQAAQADILADLAYGTGGNFYHNRNDLDVALRESVAAPAVSYLLGFSPQNLKLNGSFHTIKVSLASKQKFSLQARRGYYAPRTLKSPEETAKQEIQEAVFSQEEIRDLPLDIQTQFFRKDDTQARLSVLAHLDLKSVKFRKVEGRNDDDVTLATVIFDQNGNFVTGGQKVLELKLRDSTLERLDHSGITVKSSFDVKPGTYLVRLVVRDKEGDSMAARNGAVVIPY